MISPSVLPRAEASRATPRNMPVPRSIASVILSRKPDSEVEGGVFLVLEAGGFLAGDLVLCPQLVVLLDHLAGSVQLGDQFVDLGCQGEDPVESFSWDSCRLSSRTSLILRWQIVGIVGDAKRQREIAFISQRPSLRR